MFNIMMIPTVITAAAATPTEIQIIAVVENGLIVETSSLVAVFTSVPSVIVAVAFHFPWI